MSRKLLIETKMESLRLDESQKTQRPGCLGTLSGPCADFVDPTRNNNYYSRTLWENVFKDPLIVESVKDRVLIGELDHPGDRLETKATNAAIVMTDYSFNDGEGVVEGTFDILDTPNGRILKSLLDYGCKIGVSSRGEGDVIEESGYNRIDEESYYFVGFDAVVLPAVKKAKPVLKESLKRETLKESLRSQIRTATSLSELDQIKKVLEVLDMPDNDSLTESINIKHKELEGANSSSTLMEDLEDSISTIQDLNEEIKNLKREVVNYKSRIKKFVESRVRINEERGSLNDKYTSLSEDYRRLVFSSIEDSKKMESLKSRLIKSESTVDRLREDLRINCSSISDSESKVQNLEKSLERSQEAGRERLQVIEDLRNEIKDLRSDHSYEIESLKTRENEALERIRSSQTTISGLEKQKQDLLRSYATSRSSEYGLDSQRILESVKASTSVSDVDKIVEEEISRADRYRKLPTTNDSLLSTLSEGTVSMRGRNKPDEEMSQAKSFMEQFYNMKG